MSPMLSKLLRSFVYLVFICLWVEVGLQGFYYFTAGDFLFRRVGIPIYAREPYAGFGNRPGLSFDHRTNEFRARYYVNRAGFRVPRSEIEYTLAKPSNIYRIMLLGDSFAFGWGVNYELSFAGVLPQLLQERGFAGDKKIEIIDAGVPAMPPAAQLTWFDHVGKDYAPDLVIQVVYESLAQPFNFTAPPSDVNEDGYLTTYRRRYESLKKLATVFYGWMLWTNLGSGSTVRSSEQSGDFGQTNPEVREAMQFYNKLASIVGQAGARLLVVYVPDSYAIHREDERRWRLLGIDPRQMAFNAAFVRYLNECQILSVNTSQQLRQSARGGNRMYYWLDVHWTPAGNAAAAQAVADYLTGRP
jgi:hypothetical protein